MTRMSWILLAGALSAVGPAQAGIKCWTNNQGVRECGNTIPPEYAQKKSEVLNERGITVEVNERAKTKAELAAEARRERLEQERLSKERREREEQERRDNVLLATFATEEDITMARDRQLASIDGTIELTQTAIEQLNGKLEKYRTEAARHESQGKPIPEDLAADIETVQGQIASRETYISNKEAEKITLQKKYDEYLARFRELHQHRTGR